MKKTFLLFSFFYISIISIAQWQQTGFSSTPGGGVIKHIVTDGTHIYAISHGFGAFLSTNNGTSWTTVNNGITDFGLTSIVIIGSKVIIGTYSGMFCSMNNGSNWSQINSYPTISIEKYNNKIYAGGYGKIAVSSDSGLTWSEYSNGLPNKEIISIYANDSLILAGTSPGKIYKSVNFGSNWTLLASNVGAYSIAKIGSVIFTGGCNGGLDISTDDGNTWILNNMGLQNPIVSSIFINGENIYVSTFNRGLSLSTNAGLTWCPINSNLANLNLLSVTAFGNNIYVGSEGNGVYLSTDNGGSWNATSDGMAGITILTLLSTERNIFAGTTGGGIFKSSDNGNTWTVCNNGIPDGSYIISLAASDSTLFSGAAMFGLFRSTNNGIDWSCIASQFGNHFDINAIAIDSNKIFIGPEGYNVWMSTDNGNNWVIKGNGMPDTSFIGATINNIFIQDTNIYAASQDVGMYLSTNNGDSWTEINNGLPPSLWVLSIASIGTTVFISTVGGDVYKTADFGAHWYLVNNTMGFYSLGSYGSLLFAGTSDGVYLTADMGQNWISAGLGNKSVSNLSIKGDSIYAGIHGCGIWRRSLTELVSVDQRTDLENVILYPNPVTDQFVIIANNDLRKQLKIVNSMGQIIYISTFEKTRIIDNLKLAPGIYFAEIISAKSIKTIMFIKD